VNTDLVEPAFLTLLDADATLVGMVGHFEPATDGAPRRVPQGRYSQIFDLPGEAMGTVGYQFDVWAETRQKAMEAARRLYVVLHRNARVTVNGVTMWMLYQDSRDMPDPEPGVARRSIDFRFMPVR
jgi:hypothetical protein